MLDVAHDMRARLEHDFAAANGPLNAPVHDRAVRRYAAVDRGVRRNDEGRAVHALDVPVDFDQAFGRNAPGNL
jgi:hypothetical protein